MTGEDIGNYHFGYIARSMGYSESFIKSGAGLNQLSNHFKDTALNCLSFSLCDDLRDTFYVELGIIRYDNDNK